MINRYQFDIVVLSETWLKDKKPNSNTYVQINDYSSVWKNRESKTGGDAGFYIKEQMLFKVRHDLGTITESIEII